MERAMHSGWYGKIEKAHRYAGEKSERIQFSSFSVKFKGDNDAYTVTLQDDTWNCTCHFFQVERACCHTMALEQVLRGMLTETAAADGRGPKVAIPA